MEIGVGSGYQTAILSRFVRQVYSLEILEELSGKISRYTSATIISSGRNMHPMTASPALLSHL